MPGDAPAQPPHHAGDVGGRRVLPLVTITGGTSASAPAWNGIWARALQRHPSFGFAAPVLHRSTGGLTHTTIGSNDRYAATPGYDLSTGLGSADIAKLVKAAHWPPARSGAPASAASSAPPGSRAARGPDRHSRARRARGRGARACRA